MVYLTDRQVGAVIDAVRPLQADERTAFLASLCELLLFSQIEMGDGTLGRALRELQRKHFRPPTDEDAGMLGTRWGQKLNAAPARPPTPATEERRSDRVDRGAETIRRTRLATGRVSQSLHRIFST
jgi:hypothetical protein